MAGYPLSRAFLVEAAPGSTVGDDDVVLRVQYGELQDDPTDPALGEMVRDLNQGVGDPEAALIADLLSEGVVRRAGMTALLNIIAGQPSYDVGDKLMGRICEIFAADEAEKKPRRTDLDRIMEALDFNPWAGATIVLHDGCAASIDSKGKLGPYIIKVEELDENIPGIAATNGCTHAEFVFQIGSNGMVKTGSSEHITIGTVNSEGAFEGRLSILD